MKERKMALTVRRLTAFLLIVSVLCLAFGCGAPESGEANATTTTGAVLTTATATTTTTAATTVHLPTASQDGYVLPDPIREVIVSDEMNARLDDILATHGSTPLDIYNYVWKNYSYKWVPEQTVEENAAYLLDRGTGACYHFAALTFLLFQRAGYPVCYVTGYGWQFGDYHCWIAAEFDGDWWYVDSLYKDSAKLSADDLVRIGYDWDREVYPY